MEEFNRYKELKEKLSLRRNGIALHRPLAIEIWDLANRRDGVLWKRNKRLVYFFMRFDVSRIDISKPLLTTFALYGRKDHLQIYRNVLGKLPAAVFSENTFLKPHVKISLRPAATAGIIREIFSRTKNSGLPFKAKLILAARFTYFYNTLKTLEKMDLSRVKKYLAQSAVLYEENLFTQYFKLRGIETLSLQEGTYNVLSQNVKFESLQYENFEADKLLCWSDSTRRQFSGYGIDAGRLPVAGYPRPYGFEQFRAGNKWIKGLIMLTRRDFEDSNESLLNILGELKKEKPQMQFMLKLHPNSDFEKYRAYAKENGMEIIDKSVTLSECLDNKKFDFAIGINTTAYYEALIAGIPCLRFQDENFDITEGLEFDIFTDIGSLRKAIMDIKTFTEKDYAAQTYRMLHSVIGTGIDRYFDIIMDGIEK